MGSKQEDPLEVIFKEIVQIRETLLQDIQAEKDFPQEMASFTKAATVYRTAMMNLNVAGKALSNELKNFGDKYTKDSTYASEFANRALDQAEIEKNRIELQEKFWDEFILPNMNASDPDAKDFQKVEKKLTSLAQEIENQAKNDLKDLKKNLKSKKNKGKGDQLRTECMQSIQNHRARVETVVKYWEVWRERRYDFWLRYLCGAFEAERASFEKSCKLLQSENWKKTLENEPNALSEDKIEL